MIGTLRLGTRRVISHSLNRYCENSKTHFLYQIVKSENNTAVVLTYEKLLSHETYYLWFILSVLLQYNRNQRLLLTKLIVNE